MNVFEFNYSDTLDRCIRNNVRLPYDHLGNSLNGIARKIREGECRRYRLDVPEASLVEGESILGFIERLSVPGRLRHSIWSGLGMSLSEKVTARRNIDYYRLNLKERLRLADADDALFDQNGEECAGEVMSLFPEIEMRNLGGGLVVYFSLPNRD